MMKPTLWILIAVSWPAILMDAASMAQGVTAFDGVTVRPRATRAQSRSSSRFVDGRFEVMNITPQELVGKAHRVERRRVEAPEWARRETFDIRAVVPSGATERDIPEMLRTLLVRRFGLEVHSEQRPIQVYHLIVGSSGPMFREVAAANDLKTTFPNDDPTATDRTTGLPGVELRSISGMRGYRRITSSTSYYRKYLNASMASELDATRIRMSEFVTEISASLEHPVIDKTGLAGLYQFKTLLPPPSVDPAMAQAVFGNREPSGVSLSASLDRLGLKIELVNAPAEFVIIDKIRRPTPD